MVGVNSCSRWLLCVPTVTAKVLVHTRPCLFVFRHTKSGRPQCLAVVPVLRQRAATSPSPLAGVPAAAAGRTGGSCGMQGGPTGEPGTSSSTGQLRHRLVRGGNHAMQPAILCCGEATCCACCFTTAEPFLLDHVCIPLCQHQQHRVCSLSIRTTAAGLCNDCVAGM
jgi:hypothetical protein